MVIEIAASNLKIVTPDQSGGMTLENVPLVELVEVPILGEERECIENRLTPYKDSYELHFGAGLHPVLGTAKPDFKLWLRNDPGQGVQLMGKIVIHHTFTNMADFQPVNPIVWNASNEGFSLEDKIMDLAKRISTDKMSVDGLVFDPPVYSTETNPRSLADFYFTPPSVERTRPSRQNIPWFCYFADASTFYAIK